ncbi:MAG: serine/threonine protein kinase, partial [Actinomycetota bacterium]|nr:serine/threonine protein kinase [Actinomycetota bacterium]
MPENRLAHQLVADRYELLDTVGRGGFGVVWRARDTLLERHVAVKEIHIPGFLNEEDRAELREKVLREARAAARLDHPNAVTVFDVIDDDGHPVIVMELVDAPNLAEIVAREGPLPPDEAAQIGLEVLEVLRAAHERGIVHRDVKPANVMVSESGRVRLGDFGVAALLDDPTVTTSGAITGSPAYMAPEQATNNGAVPESDLWSLGATLYFAVEGRPPFDKGAPLPTLTSIVQDPPRPPERAGPLAPVLEGLLVKDRSARLNPDELQSRLTEVASGKSAPRPDDTMVLELDEPLAVDEPPETVVCSPPPPPPPPPRPRPEPRREPVSAVPPA